MLAKIYMLESIKFVLHLFEGYLSLSSRWGTPACLLWYDFGSSSFSLMQHFFGGRLPMNIFPIPWSLLVASNLVIMSIMKCSWCECGICGYWVSALLCSVGPSQRIGHSLVTFTLSCYSWMTKLSALNMPFLAMLGGKCGSCITTNFLTIEVHFLEC